MFEVAVPRKLSIDDVQGPLLRFPPRPVSKLHLVRRVGNSFDVHGCGDYSVKRRHPLPISVLLLQRRTDVQVGCAPIRLANRFFQLFQRFIRRSIRNQRLEHRQKLWKHHSNHLFDIRSLARVFKLVLSTQRVKHQHCPAQPLGVRRVRLLQALQHLRRHLGPLLGEIMMHHHSHRLHELRTHFCGRACNGIQRRASSVRLVARAHHPRRR